MNTFILLQDSTHILIPTEYARKYFVNTFSMPLNLVCPRIKSLRFEFSDEDCFLQNNLIMGV